MTMTRRRMWSLAIAGLTASVLVPVGLASGEVLKTHISLREFKMTYNIARVGVWRGAQPVVGQQLIDPLADGVNFKLVRRDKFGNLIDFSDPNHRAIASRLSTITFFVNKSLVPTSFESIMQTYVKFQLPNGGRSKGVTEITCGLGGTSDSGVSSLQCGTGPVVSPS